MPDRPQIAVAADLLSRLDAVGGTAWVVRGQLRLRPLDAIPDDLIASVRANTDAVRDSVIARQTKKRLAPTPEQKFLAKIRADLLRNIDGVPTKAQKLLIDRIAWLSWHVHVFDQRAVASSGLSAHASREYLAYSNSLERCTRHLINLRGTAGLSAKSGADQWSGLQIDG